MMLVVVLVMVMLMVMVKVVEYLFMEVVVLANKAASLQERREDFATSAYVTMNECVH